MEQVVDAAASPRVREYVARTARHDDTLDQQIAHAAGENDGKTVAVLVRTSHGSTAQQAQLEGVGVVNQTQQQHSGPGVVIIMPAMPAPVDELPIIEAEVIEPDER